MKVISRPVLDQFNVVFDFGIRGKARPRFNSKTSTAFMPGDYTANKSDIAWQLRAIIMQKMGFLQVGKLYTVKAVQFRKRRKAKSKKDAKTLEETCIYGDIAPSGGQVADVDNFVGTVMDAANGVVYPDDAEVAISYQERIWWPHKGAAVSFIKLGDPIWKTQSNMQSESTQQVSPHWYTLFPDLIQTLSQFE